MSTKLIRLSIAVIAVFFTLTFNAVYAVPYQNTHYSLNNYKKIVIDAKEGNPIAQNILGVIYMKGLHGEHDFTQAMKWFLKSANQGNADAQNSLGFMYDHTLGVTTDPQKARYWYQKSAAQGNPLAKNNGDKPAVKILEQPSTQSKFFTAANTACNKKHCTGLLVEAYPATVSIAATDCIKQTDKHYREMINGTWKDSETFPMGQNTYGGTTTFNKDGTFTGKIINQDDPTDVLDTVHGVWKIEQGQLYETVKKARIVPVGGTSIDKLRCMGSKTFKAMNSDKTMYTDSRLTS